MKIEYKQTDRGFRYGEFKDRYDNACSIQDSSLATEAAIWLGIDNADPQLLFPGKGWVPVAFPEGTSFKTRMHLTQPQAAELIKVLQRFVDTGSIYPVEVEQTDNVPESPEGSEST